MESPKTNMYDGAMKINLVLAEAGLEKIPREFINDKRTVKSCASLGLKPIDCLLDRSLHNWMLKSMRGGEKRGRPDIAYHILLDFTDSLLYKKGLINLFIHTYDNKVISIGKGVRPPRSYFRFEGLMVDLFNKKKIEINSVKLMEVRSSNIKELLSSIGNYTVGLSSTAKMIKIGDLAKKLTEEGSTFVIGGFPTGEFSKETIDCFDEIFSIYPEPLEATTVANRIIYELEKIKGIWD